MNKLLPWDLAIFLKKLRCIVDFKFWDAPSFTFPTHLGNNKSLVFIWSWSSIFISETVVMQISQLFMFQATHTWFIVAQVMSFGEWLSIIARSELGSDLDCSVINAWSELGSDLDCYELIACNHNASNISVDIQVFQDKNDLILYTVLPKMHRRWISLLCLSVQNQFQRKFNIYHSYVAARFNLPIFQIHITTENLLIWQRFWKYPIYFRMLLDI